MLERETTIKNKLGLHARAASKFIELSQRFAASVEVVKGSQTANGKSIMSMMMLQATKGTSVIIRANGEDESEALEAILQLIDNLFGEAE